MSDDAQEPINVVIATQLPDDLVARIRDISPDLHVEVYPSQVPTHAWAKAEILYTARNFPEPDQVPHLRWIQLPYAGMEKIAQERIVQAEDVMITSASGIHSPQIANFCLMAILAFHYKLLDMIQFKEKKEWSENRFHIFQPVGMNQLTVGIVGYGSIGREVARLCNFLGMSVLASKNDLRKLAEEHAYQPEGIGDPTGEIPDRIYPAEALKSMAKEVDYLVLTIPLTEQSRHMVDEDILNAMKPSAVLINIARGAIIDEPMLITALSSEKIRGAALDVFEVEPLPATSPLWNMDNVIISPHVSGNIASYQEDVIQLFSENVHRYLNNEPLLNLLNREKGY